MRLKFYLIISKRNSFCLRINQGLLIMIQRNHVLQRNWKLLRNQWLRIQQL